MEFQQDQKERYEMERAKVGLLFQSAANNDIPELKKCCQEGDVLGYKDGNGRTALHFAASGGHLEACKVIVESLRDKYSGISLVDVNNDSPLRLAVRFGHVKVAEYLYNLTDCSLQSAETKQSLKDQPTLLAEACSSSQHEMVDLVLNKFNRQHEVNIKSRVGTPLFWAAFNDNADVAKLLLAAGADPNARDEDGSSSLLVSMVTNSKSVVALLLKAGASLHVNTSQEGETTVLHAAASAGALDAIKALLETSPEQAKAVTSAKSSEGYTPIELAAYSGHLNVVNELAKIDNLSGKETSAMCERMRAQREKDEQEEASEISRVEQECKVLKNSGNDLFKSGEIDAAIDLYSKAIRIAEKLVEDLSLKNKALCGPGREDTVVRVQQDVITLLMCNRSACFLKIGKTEEARMDAVKATELNPKWVKAFYRLGLAYNELKDYPQAAQAFWTGYELEPKAPGAKVLFQFFQEAVKLGKAAEKET